MTSIMWFRKDLRLDDNPALLAASKESKACLPIYILDPSESLGSASQWWLHHSLTSLDQALQQLGGRLVLLHGDPEEILLELTKEGKADSVYWNRRYSPYAVELDTRIKGSLEQNGTKVKTFNGSLLFEPWEVQKAAGGPYQVYTPFWNALKAKSIPRPDPSPEAIRLPQKAPESVPIEQLNLLPSIPWDSNFYSCWRPGEEGARERLDHFMSRSLTTYEERRNVPGVDGTSKLSPHLAFGEISPRSVWDAGHRRHVQYNSAKDQKNSETYLKELVWREFGYHLLFHFPSTVEKPLREQFERFPWRTSKKDLRAWQKGMTGYPIVDAGMRQLWQIGWMHNRVRMIVGSFLVKHLLLPWQDGEAWFFDTLVDADKASNTLGWQWIAGCGADAAPYFRVFNPILQGEKFDPEGEYIKQWVPELSKLPSKWIHKPWECPKEVLKRSEVTLGSTYPRPIVDHAESRSRALRAYDEIKR